MNKSLKVLVGLVFSTVSSMALAQQKVEYVSCFSTVRPFQFLIEKEVGTDVVTNSVLLILDPQTGAAQAAIDITVGSLKSSNGEVSFEGEAGDETLTISYQVKTKGPKTETGVDENGQPYSVEVYEGTLDLDFEEGTETDQAICVISEPVDN